MVILSVKTNGYEAGKGRHCGSHVIEIYALFFIHFLFQLAHIHTLLYLKSDMI